MNPLPIIHGRRVSLRALFANDLDSIYTIFSHPQVMRYWSFPPLPAKAAAEKLLAGIISDVERGAIMKWGIARQSDDVVIGTVTLFNINLENGRAEVGYA